MGARLLVGVCFWDFLRTGCPAQLMGVIFSFLFGFLCQRAGLPAELMGIVFSFSFDVIQFYPLRGLAIDGGSCTEW